jgi:hypothetical protein
MKQLRGLIWIAALLSVAAPACINEPGDVDETDNTGKLALPLVANSPNGVKYRLRDAVFDINPQYWYDESGNGEMPAAQVVNSEDNPNADSIRVSLERGYYYINLRSGWRMEKIENGEAETVEATLLNSSNQWMYINSHSTSWVTYQFGIGNRTIWLNGNLNVRIEIFDNPGQYYGDEDAGYGNGGAGGSCYNCGDAG